VNSFLLRWVINAVAVAVAAHFTGVHYDGLLALALAALILGVVNAAIRPILLFFSLPFILLTFGLFILVVNALSFWLVGAIVPGFHVNGFRSAFFGALIVSIVSWLISRVASDEPRPSPRVPRGEIKQVKGRVVEP
jgi:putative membrane protein